MEPLVAADGKTPTEAEIERWGARFDALPLKEKNRVIRESKKFAETVYGGAVFGGNMLISPVAAENQNDSDAAEFTFLTILKPMRERLVREYEIKTGAEFMLLDALVLSYYQYIRAATNLHSYTAYGKSYNYETLVRYAQAYLARANEMFLRNLEALRQMKAAPFVIKIEQAGQVNVGEKQVNVAGDPPVASADAITAQEAPPRAALPGGGESSEGDGRQTA